VKAKYIQQAELNMFSSVWQTVFKSNPVVQIKCYC